MSTEQPQLTTDGTPSAGAPSAGTAPPSRPPSDAAPPSAAPPDDPFTAFAPVPERRPGRGRRIVRAIGRALLHEWSLASLGALLLAVVMTWPTLRYPMHTLPQDIWDPTLQAWQLAWSGHILLTDPAQLWHSNTFYPERYSYAFSDSLLGYAPASLIGEGPAAAILRYNIIFVLAYALVFVGGYALVRQLGAGKIGAAVAAAAFAYAPWRLSQAGHLHVMSSGGIFLALAMLARGHGWSLRHGYRPERRNLWWALGGWAVAAWQLSLGFGIGLLFAYALAVIVVVAAVTFVVRQRWFWMPRRPFGWRLLTADLVGGLVFGAVGLLMALPYFRVADLHPNAKRSFGEIDFYSPPLNSFLIAPAESRIWGEQHALARDALPWHPEMTLLPGFVLLGVAVAGLVFSVWTLRQRMLLLLGVLLSGALTMGTQFFGGKLTYVPLFNYLPGWEGLRTPGRLVFWTTLFLGVLAAGALSAFGQRAGEFTVERVPARPGPALRLVLLLPLLLVLAEGLNVTPHPIVPTQPTALRTVDGPMLVLPSDPSVDQHVMLWSTSRFQQVANGSSGFTPEKTAEIRKMAQTFPDATSVAYLKDLGIQTVVLLRDRVGGTPWETTIDLPVDTLGIRREDLGNDVVFRL